eukprot:CAMPEP_0119053894 /NCGR_PEP_ID=MMETSP1177-20130426/74720_1 /TAXON_ID=2985 /ORGANISM="Ochromonas sp, Strain CCMP1899" /LENGTH=284 /DNA_ID=CAMNT_0007033969 /DNA_START=923 /DNA_END=1774 /DNA_ORIENTATION=-
MELILKINGDLSSRIADTVSARAHIRNITERLIPPHYAWPKELSYDCIQNIVSASAEKLKEGNGIHLHSPSKISKNPTYQDGGCDDDDVGHINLNLDNNWEEESVLERGRRNTFDLDAAYRALSTDPNRRRASSSHSQDPNRRRASSSHSKGTIHSQQVRGKEGSSSSKEASSSSSPSKGSRVGRDSEKINGANSSSSPHRNRPPVSYINLDKHDSAYNQAVSAAAATVLSGGGVLEGSRAGFIPGGNTEGKEFNVFAKGSKIARATAQFNAAVAARVKAYKKN